MIKNTTLITNSVFSQRAIHNVFGIDNSFVIYPLVDVKKFREESLLPSIRNRCRKNTVIVVCRIDPSKMIERALQLAVILSNKNIGEGMVIIGNLDPFFQDYYTKLEQTIVDYKLTDYVKFEINISLSGLFEYLKRGSILFHPKTGEHFGMSIVEGISAGLIPVVPTIGGQNEFVPHDYL
jgi:glycosyltransferase involved in cell wall biosynthesis